MKQEQHVLRRCRRDKVSKCKGKDWETEKSHTRTHMHTNTNTHGDRLSRRKIQEKSPIVLAKRAER